MRKRRISIELCLGGLRVPGHGTDMTLEQGYTTWHSRFISSQHPILDLNISPFTGAAMPEDQHVQGPGQRSPQGRRQGKRALLGPSVALLATMATQRLPGPWTVGAGCSQTPRRPQPRCLRVDIAWPSHIPHPLRHEHRHVGTNRLSVCGGVATDGVPRARAQERATGAPADRRCRELPKETCGGRGRRGQTGTRSGSCRPSGRGSHSVQGEDGALQTPCQFYYERAGVMPFAADGSVTIWIPNADIPGDPGVGGLEAAAHVGRRASPTSGLWGGVGGIMNIVDV